jgi:CBS domain containing-hemolysin-like protein
MVLLFGDITPKTLAKESPELTALRMAPFIRFFIIVFTPLNYLSAAWKKLIIKLFPSGHDRSATEDELLIYVEEVRQEGGINKHEEHMIRQVIEFDELTAAEVYIPRVDVTAVSQDSTIEEIDNVFSESGFSRLPVFQDSIDNITGIILLKDFHHEVMKGKKALTEIIKSVIFVTKTMKIAKLLKTLQKKQSHLAVVVDEFGGTMGIITIEDIVEQLVGEIWDEHDEVVEQIKKINNSCFIVMANVYFKDMIEFIVADNENVDKCKDKYVDIPSTTLGNWITEKLGRLPHIGEDSVWCNFNIRASKIIRHRIMEIIVNVNTAEENGKE